MQQTCPRCGSLSDASSRFCTNCGAVRETVQPYRQSWEGAPVQSQGQLPSWSQTPGNAYQQQMYAGNQNPNAGGLGFGGQGDSTAKKLLLIVGVTIASALLLLVGSIALALVTPAPVSTFFWVLTIVIVVIAWIIYSQIRRIIRRTVGSIWRFL